MSRSLAFALLLLVTLCAPVRAQSLSAPPPSYQPLLDEALHEFALGNYREALALFRDAQQQWPNARALRAIGRCHYELGDYVAANESLEDALQTQVRSLAPGQRAETEQLLARVREQLARFTVVTTPPSAALLVDGNPVTRDEAGVVVLALGVHSLEATASGYMPAHREVVAEAQREERVELTLIPLVAAEPAQAPIASVPEPQADKPLRKKWWLWTSVAGAVVVATVAAVLIARRDTPEPARPAGGTSGVAIGVPTASQ